MKKVSLTTQIFVAMLLGILVGWLMVDCADIATNYIKPIGTIFVNLLKFIVVPMVLVSICCGTIAMEDVKKIGSVGWKTVVFYTFTCICATVIGLVFANMFKGFFPVLDIADAAYEAKTANFMDTLVNIFPSNMWKAFLDANMLQVIFISFALGFAVLACGEKGKPTRIWLESLNEVLMKIMMGIIACTPIGVFCLMTATVASNGPEIIGSLAVVLGVAYLAYIAQVFIVYFPVVKLLAGISPIYFFKCMMPPMLFAFTSTSSVATLPLTMEAAHQMGADPDLSAFIVPFGANINMDGTAIYMGVASVFIACCYGVNLTISQMATIVVTAVLASVGTAGVAGAGMIMLAMVLESVSLPVSGIALIMGVDKIFDMGRTTVNIMGDSMAAIIMTNLEKKKAARQAKAGK